MGLNQESYTKLRSDYKSYIKLSTLLKDIFKVNAFSPKKKISISIIIVLLFISSIIISSKFEFQFIFNKLSALNISISITLLALLIAGFSLVLSGLNKDSLYLLILSTDSSASNSSFFKRTILLCVEPLIWFMLLLFITLIFELLYLLYPSTIICSCVNSIIKCIIIFILLIAITFSVLSLKTFILNICNLLLMCANFEMLSRQAKSKDEKKGVDLVIESFENKLNSKK